MRISRLLLLLRTKQLALLPSQLLYTTHLELLQARDIDHVCWAVHLPPARMVQPQLTKSGNWVAQLFQLHRPKRLHRLRTRS